MDEQVPEQADATGVPAVDDVLRQVAQLAERPVSEHVEVFERAHEQLRRALDARPGVEPAPGHGA